MSKLSSFVVSSMKHVRLITDPINNCTNNNMETSSIYFPKDLQKMNASAGFRSDLICRTVMNAGSDGIEVVHAPEEGDIVDDIVVEEEEDTVYRYQQPSQPSNAKRT